MDFSSITQDSEVGAVVCGLDMHFNYKKIAKAHRYLRENEGCLFIATNLDSTFPTHGSVYPGTTSKAGERAQSVLTLLLVSSRCWINDRATEVLRRTRPARDRETRERHVGEYRDEVGLLPSSETKRRELILGVGNSFGLDKSKTIMVGDRLDTDIQFGNRGGIDTLMVLTGVNQRADFEKEGAVAVPTFVVEGLGDFAVLAN